MDAHEIEKVKRQVNIVDVVSQYVRLKKNGKNYSACCPFHSEKTPSFTVSEDKQFYHCFGCGAHGDVLDWMQEYCRMDFVESIKALGGEVEMMPPEKVARNEKRIVIREKLPPDHKEDPDLSSHALKNCEKVNDYYRAKGGKVYLPMMTAYGELKNLVYFESYDESKESPCFIAGGPSYDSFYSIIKNNKPTRFAVVSLKDGYAIASRYKINVAVCFTGAIMKYVCKWNYGELKIMPVIAPGDDDWLSYEMPWASWDGKELKKQERVND